MMAGTQPRAALLGTRKRVHRFPGATVYWAGSRIGWLCIDASGKVLKKGSEKNLCEWAASRKKPVAAL